MDNNDKLVAAHTVGGIKTALAALGPFGGVINEVISMIQADMLEKRLQDTEKYIREFVSFKGLSFEEFTSGLDNLNEHDYYVVRKSFKHLVMEAQPETVEVLCKAMVDYSLGVEQDINQIVCEVLSALNSFDIRLLHNIKQYIESKEHQDEMKRLSDLNTQETITSEEGKNKSVTGYKRKHWVDRNVVHGKYTVMWHNFSLELKDKKDGNDTILPATKAINIELAVGEKIIYKLAQEVISIIKMQGLGILETEHATTMGSTSLLNISRFHITLLGRKILDYIDIEKEEK